MSSADLSCKATEIVTTSYLTALNSSPLFIISTFFVTYALIHSYSNYLAGFVVGVGITVLLYYLKFLLDTPLNPAVVIPAAQGILEVQAVKEFQPLSKYEVGVGSIVVV
jgi:hypothetical protein